jgi:hypothetical protein
MTTASGDQSLRSWNDGATVAAIRDFVARVTADGSPEFLPAAERVAVFDNDGTLWCEKPMPIYFNDGPTKPLRIWSRVGRRPVVAGGNSNGDIEMLQFAGGPSRPGLRLLVLHDDPEREFDYVAGAERALEAAKVKGWTVVSVKRDWATVFDDATASTQEEGS